MNPEAQCAIHPEAAAIAYCRDCGRAICEECGRRWQGVLHCVECMTRLSQEASAGPQAGRRPAAPEGSLPGSGSGNAPPSRDRPSAVLALVLGLIPGVGAVYNGQYAKGVVHVVIFGGLISLLNSDASRGAGAILALLTILMFFYMPLEAYRTARALEQGRPVDELSGFLEPGRGAAGSPLGGIVLIVLGVALLLQSLGYWRLASLLPYWPATLIALGIYMLYRRIAEDSEMERLRETDSRSRSRSGTFDLARAPGPQSPKPSSEGPPSGLDVPEKEERTPAGGESGGAALETREPAEAVEPDHGEQAKN